ncbi:unnamed protein product, partial [Prorocentrum cordatum]
MTSAEPDYAPSRLPVNTHGGLLAFGAPWEVPAMYNVIEAVEQLAGRAGGRQVPGARRALVYGNGGIFSHSAVAILAAPVDGSASPPPDARGRRRGSPKKAPRPPKEDAARDPRPPEEQASAPPPPKRRNCLEMGVPAKPSAAAAEAERRAAREAKEAERKLQEQAELEAKRRREEQERRQLELQRKRQEEEKRQREAEERRREQARRRQKQEQEEDAEAPQDFVQLQTRRMGAVELRRPGPASPAGGLAGTASSPAKSLGARGG